MANTTAMFQLCAPRGMIPIGSGPMPFDADVHSVATLTVTCGDNRRTEVERLGTELAVIVFKHLVMLDTMTLMTSNTGDVLGCCQEEKNR